VALTAGGRERIVGPGADSSPRETTWGCFLMAPWVGRLAGARLEWEGRAYPLEANLAPHAIHGVVFDERWEVNDLRDAEASLSCLLDAKRWPLGGAVHQRVELSPGSLTLRATVRAGPRSMPAALGWHPWFRRAGHGDVRVRIDAGEVLETTADLIPTGRTTSVQRDTDLRRGPPLGARRLDNAYPSARSPAVIRWPDLAMRIDFEAPLSTVVVYTPPEGICVEPQSAWPDAGRRARPGVEGMGGARMWPGGARNPRQTWSWRGTR
jgi:aldose 1-epimerase